MEDVYGKLKYAAARDIDYAIIQRVQELAVMKNVTIKEISLAWLLTKVTAPVAGAAKLHHVDGAVRAVEIELSEQECTYLEELYQPHKLVGVMVQNTESPKV